MAKGREPQVWRGTGKTSIWDPERGREIPGAFGFENQKGQILWELEISGT